MAFRKIDQKWVVDPLVLVVFSQLLPQVGGLDANHIVDARIEVRRALEDFDAQRELLQPIDLSRQRAGDDKVQKLLQTPCLSKVPTPENQRQLILDLFCARLVCCWKIHFLCRWKLSGSGRRLLTSGF